MKDPERKPVSFDERVLETRAAIRRMNEAREILDDVIERLLVASEGERAPGTNLDQECERAEVHFREAEADLIRIILAWGPAVVQMPGDRADRLTKDSRGIIVDGVTYTIFQDHRPEDEPDSSVPVDLGEIAGPDDSPYIWRMVITRMVAMVDLDAAFGA